MVKASLSNLDLFKIVDESTKETHLGGSQEWYGTEHQRRAGCGPCVAAVLVSYMLRSKEPPEERKKILSKKEFVSLMEEMWNYVTPSDRGLPSTDLFYKYLLSYAKDKGLPVSRCAICDMHSPSSRPLLLDVINFIDGALNKDLPIAFLNLDSGKEDRLDEWHWAVITAIEHDARQAFVDVIDGGSLLRIDLALWYETTKLGGGFVFFELKNRCQS